MGDECSQKPVGLQDGVVVSVHQFSAILRLSVAGVVGKECCFTVRITLSVFEMRAVGVQHDELLLPFAGQYAVYQWQQALVVAIVSTVFPYFNELPFIGLLAKEVDERVVGQLVGEENGVETRLAKGRK